MRSFLKNHPFAVEAFFDATLVLTFAAPKEELSHLIPECLELDTFDNKWGFVAVAIVATKGLRPKGFPKFLGNDFVLVGYRVFVRYHNNKGKRLRGLYILKSETDSPRMTVIGNLLTHYNYTTTDINFEQNGNLLQVNAPETGLHIKAFKRTDESPLPPSSPFTDWKEARRFAGPLPFTFSYDAEKKQVLIIEGVRENWTPGSVEVLEANIPFVGSLNLSNPILAGAFIVEQIPYYWKKGKTEIWKG